jgi:glycosyltransferase involved in cell wall biosynthesis
MSIMVSVIIPTYNRAHLLKKALDSVTSQTHKDLELIVVDDGSIDNTAEVVESIEEPVRYFSIPHSGVSKARNAGLEHARGEWIAFLDSDDYWLPAKLEKQLEYLGTRKPPCCGYPRYRLCHTDEIWIRDGKRINQGKKHHKYEGWFFKPSLHLCLISPSSVLIHRCVFESVGGFDESFEYVEDYDLWLRICSRFPVGYLDEKLIVKTGGHKDQLSARIEGIEYFRLQALEKLILKGNLGSEFLSEAIDIFRLKTEIYILGCKKRGKIEEIEELQKKVAALPHKAGSVSP